MEATSGEDEHPLICSVVLLFNHYADSDECIQSLLAQEYRPHRIFAVDNGSADDSLRQLQDKWFGQVTFIANGANLGVPAGYNVGMRAALEAGAQYVVLCNNDIVTEPAFISELHAVFGTAKSAAIVVPTVLYYDRPELVWFGKTRFHPLLAYSRDPYRDKPLASFIDGVPGLQESDYVTTCASMLSRKAIEAVGLLDERFFLGHDDVDWCLRARAQGFEAIVLAKGLVRHKVSVSQGVRGSNILGPTSIYTQAAGAYLIGLKHFRRMAGLPFLAGLFMIRVPYNLTQIVLARRWRSLLPYLQGVRDGFVEYAPYFRQPVDQIPKRTILPRR